MGLPLATPMSSNTVLNGSVLTFVVGTCSDWVYSDLKAYIVNRGLTKNYFSITWAFIALETKL